MARSTMATLITEVRQRTYAGTADYTIAGSAYWVDDQLEDVLDRHREDIFRLPVSPVETYSSGTIQYLDYPLPFPFWESTNGGTAIFYVEDAGGTAVGTASYTVDYNRGYVTFGSDTSGSVYYVYGRIYDVDGAAAEVWRHKAGYLANRATFATDNHRVEAGKLYQQALDMAKFYESRSTMGASQTVTIVRSDIDVLA